MQFTKSRSARRAALALCFACWITPAFASSVAPNETSATRSYYSVPADYSWTQLFSLQDPDWQALGQFGSGWGSGLFLMTGNTANNYNGALQLLLIGSVSGTGQAQETGAAVPEPSAFVLGAFGLLLAGSGVFRVRWQAVEKIEELSRR